MPVTRPTPPPFPTALPSLAPGSCEWTVEHVEGIFRTTFLVKEHTHVLAAIPQATELEVRAGCFSVNHAHPMVVMFRVHGRHYRVFLNCYSGYGPWRSPRWAPSRF